jgi:RNA polymerase sigma-70 factor (ECF subfamily)
VKPSETLNKTDDQLIKASIGGDKVAFSALVRRYEDLVYKFAFKVCRDTEKAEETLQDTFVNVYRKLGSFNAKSKFSTWLYSIVMNNCLMKRRTRRRAHEVMVSLDEPPAGNDGSRSEHLPRWEETPADVMINRELRDLLDTSILKLPIDYRLVFVLRDIEGKTTEETAKIMKISQEATKSRLRRARAFLRKQLAPYMQTNGK